MTGETIGEATGEVIGVEAFRLEARAWIEQHLERRQRTGRSVMRTETKSPEEVAASRALQQKLFDGLRPHRPLDGGPRVGGLPRTAHPADPAR
jgi:hypothetical protein